MGGSAYTLSITRLSRTVTANDQDNIEVIHHVDHVDHPLLRCLKKRGKKEGDQVAVGSFMTIDELVHDLTDSHTVASDLRPISRLL